MRIEQVKDKAVATKVAAKLFMEKANSNAYKPFGLATGSTMDGVFLALKEFGYYPQAKDAFALDNYLGIDSQHKNSYLMELSEKFSTRLGWMGTLHVPGTKEYSGDGGAALFESVVSELGPISVQLLGLGTNGHIAFNEPGSSFDSRTRVVELAEQTRIDNSRFFEHVQEVPTHAVTQGLATISGATSLILLVLGERKRPALLEALESPGPQTPLAPLLDHPDITLVTDLAI